MLATVIFQRCRRVSTPVRIWMHGMHWGGRHSYYAVYNEHLKIVELLVRNGANLNAKHKANKIVLHLAAELRNLGMVRLLMKAGAKVNALDSDQDTPLDWAIGTLHNDTADLIRKNGGKRGAELEAEGKSNTSYSQQSQP